MSKPPIKAFETVKRYCETRKTCQGCPLHSVICGVTCFDNPPSGWTIRKGPEAKREK